jgi:hypothetical protein
MDNVLAIYAEEDNEDHIAMPDMPEINTLQFSFGDVDNVDDHATDSPTNAVHTSAAADTAARDRLREHLATIKSASYQVPLAAVMNALEVVQHVSSEMLGFMAGDFDLMARPRGRSRGERYTESACECGARTLSCACLP